MREEPLTVLVEVRGGVVVNVYTDEPAKYAVLDHDNQAVGGLADDEEPEESDESLAHCWECSPVEEDPGEHFVRADDLCAFVMRHIKDNPGLRHRRFALYEMGLDYMVHALMITERRVIRMIQSYIKKG